MLQLLFSFLELSDKLLFFFFVSLLHGKELLLSLESLLLPNHLNLRLLSLLLDDFDFFLGTFPVDRCPIVFNFFFAVVFAEGVTWVRSTDSLLH